jgi:translation initiation factor 1 (eIF-1/SUI1)
MKNDESDIIIMDFTEKEIVVSATEPEKQVRITLARYKKTKWQTIIEGLDYTLDKSVTSEKELLTKLKKEVCHSNGHITEQGRYLFQGEKTAELLTYLDSIGVYNVITSGTK